MAHSLVNLESKQKTNTAERDYEIYYISNARNNISTPYRYQRFESRPIRN